MLWNTEEAFKNGCSGDTGNVGNTRSAYAAWAILPSTISTKLTIIYHLKSFDRLRNES
jgi:hypothetical protein